MAVMFNMEGEMFPLSNFIPKICFGQQPNCSYFCGLAVVHKKAVRGITNNFF